MDIERLRALEKAVELVAKATPDAWAVGDKEYKGPHCNYVCIGAPWQDVAHVRGSHDAMVDTVAGVRYMRANAEAIVAAVNFIREHGSALIAELGQEVGAVACRGYAKLGIGAYLIEHSAESEPAALMLCIASDEEKAGRTVGDLKTFEGERQPIPVEKMTVRIDFANVAGLDALEQQLRILREVHFPTSPAHTSEARDAARYRWLRDAARTTDFDTPRWTVSFESGGWGETYRGETLDKHIDAAMEGGNG